MIRLRDCTTAEKFIAEKVVSELTDRIGTEVAKKHDMWWVLDVDGSSPLHVDRIICCKCGWVYRLSLMQTITTKSSALIQSLRLHIEEIVVHYSPTLTELTELGWFNSDD